MAGTSPTLSPLTAGAKAEAGTGKEQTARCRVEVGSGEEGRARPEHGCARLSLPQQGRCTRALGPRPGPGHAWL